MFTFYSLSGPKDMFLAYCYSPVSDDPAGLEDLLQDLAPYAPPIRQPSFEALSL